jgi:hypothetical protein
MQHRVPIHAYRLRYPDSPHAPVMLSEWERPSIDRLLWNAKTFGREVVQRYFADWDALTEENSRFWDAYYLLRPAYEPWEGWQAWMDAYREIVRDVQALYEECHGHIPNDHRHTRQDVPEHIEYPLTQEEPPCI